MTRLFVSGVYVTIDHRGYELWLNAYFSSIQYILLMFLHFDS